MSNKISLLSLVISGSLATVPMAAIAEPEVYGLVDIGLEVYNDDESAGADIFQGFNSVAGNSDERAFTLSNGMTSRLGVRGSEPIDVADAEASYNIELEIDVLDDASNDTRTRLGWLALGNDLGMLKVGAQWSALYEFGGWNTYRNDVHGYGAYYYTTSQLDTSLAFGFRQDSAISYQYGSAWTHSDPFAFNVSLGIGEGDDNEAGVSSATVAGQYSYNEFISINGVYLAEFKSTDAGDDPEPTLFNVGARYSLIDGFELAANYVQINLDDADDNMRNSVSLAAMTQFENGYSGLLGVANGSDDRDAVREIDVNVYGYVKRLLSERTNVRIEFESIQYSEPDASASVGLLAIQHNF